MRGGTGGRRALQAVVSLLGAVAIVAGSATLLFGADSVTRGAASPSVDSELRFYAAWYVAAGLLLLRAVAWIEEATFLIRVAGLALLLAASARALSWATVGRPPTISIVLMAIEYALPLVLLPWQAAVARRANAADRAPR